VIDVWASAVVGRRFATVVVHSAADFLRLWRCRPVACTACSLVVCCIAGVSVITRCLGAVLRAMTTMLCVFTASFAAAADDAAAVECCLLYLLSARRNASDQFAVCQLTGTQIETEKIK